MVVVAYHTPILGCADLRQIVCYAPAKTSSSHFNFRNGTGVSLNAVVRTIVIAIGCEVQEFELNSDLMAGGDRKIPVTINHGFVGGFDYARFINAGSEDCSRWKNSSLSTSWSTICAS